MLPVSRDLEMNMKKLNDNPPFKIVPNVVDVELFQPTTKSTQKDKIKFLHISTFAEQKNMNGLLRVFKKLSEHRQDFTLTMAGDGDLEELNQKVAQHNFPEEMIFTSGKMNEKEVAAMLSLIHI